MMPEVQMVGNGKMGTAIKPWGWHEEKTGSEECGTAPGSGWVFQTLDLMGSGPCPIGTGCVQVALLGLAFLRGGRAAHGKGPGGSQLFVAAEKESDTL